MSHISILPLLFTCLCIYGQEQPQAPLAEASAEHISAVYNSPFRLQWELIGPVLNSARVEAIQLHPTEPGVFYVAFGSGNLWKSTNHGVTWTPLIDSLPIQGIGDIALAPSNPETLYLGSGESLKKARNFTMPGNGIYRSDDGGSTWRHLGLDDTWHIGEIAVNPQNADHIVVAAQGHFWSSNPHRGVFTSTDGGATFDHTLFVSDSVGANDIVIAASDPSVIYASMWENYPDIKGSRSSVYRSQDGGMTWEKRSNGLPDGSGTGRIGLAVSHQDPLKAYALIDNLNHPARYAAEVYKTEDGGEHWARTHADTLFIFPGIGWYFTDIYVNPEDDEEIFALGVRMAHSKDGGATFDLVQGQVQHINPSPAQRLHLDHCELFIHPTQPDILALGNDGGFYLSYDKGEHWTHFNNIPAGEFYDITIGPGTPYTIYGGTQDNSTVYGPPTAYNPEVPDPWEYLWIDAWSGGDGCMTYVDPDDPNTVYFSLQHGAMRRKDIAADTSKNIRPDLEEELGCDVNFSFVAPYFLSRHNSKVLYTAGNYALRSPDRGDSWEPISPDLTLFNGSVSRSVAAGAMAESPLQAGVLYVGMDHGEVFRSDDNGKSWVNCSSGLPDAYVRSIHPSQHDTSRIYVALTGLNYDDHSAYVYASENKGQTWIPLHDGLPGAPVNVVVEDPIVSGLLYAGTMHGVYMSFTGAHQWHRLGTGLPTVSIADLEFHTETGDLVAATHGRGIWKANITPIHWMLRNSSRMGEIVIMPPDTGRLPQFNDTHGEPLYNTGEKLALTFWLPSGGACRLSILDGREEIWSVAEHGHAGMNQFLWDLVLKQVESQKPYHIHYDVFIKPGEYTLQLEFENASTEAPITIRDYHK